MTPTFILLVDTSRSVMHQTTNVSMHPFIPLQFCLFGRPKNRKFGIFSSVDGAIDTPEFPGRDALVVDVDDDDWIAAVTLNFNLTMQPSSQLPCEV